MKDHIFDCGEKYEFMVDHRSCTHNLSSCEITDFKCYGKSALKTCMGNSLT